MSQLNPCPEGGGDEIVEVELGVRAPLEGVVAPFPGVLSTVGVLLQLAAAENLLPEVDTIFCWVTGKGADFEDLRMFSTKFKGSEWDNISGMQML